MLTFRYLNRANTNSEIDSTVYSKNLLQMKVTKLASKPRCMSACMYVCRKMTNT